MGYQPGDPDEVCTGMDVPCDRWTAEDVAFWTARPHYQPWKDVAAFFRAAPPHQSDDPPPSAPGRQRSG